MSIRIPIIGIDYDDPDVSTYRGCTLSMGDGELILDSGRPEHDYWAISHLARTLSPVDFVMCSSSVDHFAYDGGTIDE